MEPAAAGTTRAPTALNMKVSPREQVESLPTDALFAYAAELLRRNPPHAADQPVLARLRGEGLIPGRPFDFDKLDHPRQQGMRRGLRAARERMQAAAGATLREANGWQREAAASVCTAMPTCAARWPPRPSPAPACRRT